MTNINISLAQSLQNQIADLSELCCQILCLFRLTQVDDHNSMEASVADMTPLHIMLTPQGSSAITMRLEPMSSAASPTKSADAVQEQFQQQLRKAKATLLPDFSMHRSSSSQVQSYIARLACPFTSGLLFPQRFSCSHAASPSLVIKRMGQVALMEIAHMFSVTICARLHNQANHQASVRQDVDAVKLLSTWSMTGQQHAEKALVDSLTAKRP